MAGGRSAIISGRHADLESSVWTTTRKAEKMHDKQVIGPRDNGGEFLRLPGIPSTQLLLWIFRGITARSLLLVGCCSIVVV